MKNIRKTIVAKLIFLIYITTASTNICFAQTDELNYIVNNKDIASISFISEYPSTDSEKTKSLSTRFINFVFGKKNSAISKPINVFAWKLNDYFVNDQGKYIIYSIKNNVGEIPRFLKQKNKTFPSLVGICGFIDDKILVTDSYLNKIYVLSTEKNTIEVLNNSLILNQPTGIVYSPYTEEIYVVETKAHRISVLNKEGKLIRQIGNRGTGKGEFNFPTFICIDNLGIIYVVDSMNFRVQIFDKKGELINVFGEIGDATGYFSRPKGIAVDSFGNIYIADALFNTIQIFDKNGNFLFSFGDKGNKKGQFFMPTGIYIDKDNYIYIADSYNSRVQIFKINKTK